MGKLRNDAGSLPNLNILAVNELARFLGGFLIISTGNNFRKTMDVAISIEKIDAICWHSESRSGGSATLSVTE
jgi:hypothetical protein